jgi:hypothetical protein
MRVRRYVIAAWALALTFCAVAVAATLPKPHTEYFYVRHAKPAFSIHLGTKSATRIGAAKPRSTAFPSSGFLVLCQMTSGSPVELQMGFPEATLKLRKGHYGFKVSYMEKRAALVTFTKTGETVAYEPAHATVTGTVEKTKLIAGTLSVSATGCNLKTSKYKATPFKLT